MACFAGRSSDLRLERPCSFPRDDAVDCRAKVSPNTAAVLCRIHTDFPFHPPSEDTREGEYRTGDASTPPAPKSMDWSVKGFGMTSRK